MIEKRKTKTVAGQILNAESFAYVGDSSDVSTWKLPLLVPGNLPLTRNLVKTAWARFADTKIPESERQSVWLIIVGACKTHGIPAQHQAPAKSELKTAAQPLDAQEVLLRETLAVAALHRDKFLHALGYGDT